MKSTAKSYKTPGTKLSKAQKMVKDQIRINVRNKNAMFDTSSKGVGKYANKDKISWRAYKLEKRALKNEALGLNTKPQMIKAAGQALAMNLSPSLASYSATAGTGKLIEGIKSGSQNQNIGSLIQGGVNQATTSNEEEEKEGQETLPLPGGYNLG